MTMIDVRHASRVLLIGAVWLAGCSSGPQPILYTLGPSAGVVEAPRGALKISLPAVDLPAYARSNLIASADGPNRVLVDDNHRWASPPGESVTLALAQHLESKLDATVLVQPHPRGFAAELVIDVSFDRFLRTASGAAEVHGRAVIVRSRTESLEVVRFTITAPTSGDGYVGFMVSMDRALAQVAALVASRVENMPPS